MRTLLLALCCCGLASATLANESQDVLQTLLQQSEVVVSGEFTSDFATSSDEQGIANCQASLRIERLLKSPANLDKLRGGQTIRVSIDRFEGSTDDSPAHLKPGGKAVLFLRTSEGSPRTFTTVDPWFGIQPADAALVDTLARLGDQPQTTPAEKVVENKPAAPAKQPKAPLSLDGEWRLFLPAGFEYEATLTKDRRDANCYDLMPGGLTFGKRFEVHGDFVVSYPDDQSARRGVFRWKINSPYLLTLVEQPKNAGGSYLGAVFTRHSPPMKERRQAKQPIESSHQLPQTSLEELDAIVAAGNYHLVRQQKIGAQVEAVGEVTALFERYPDAVLVDLPGKYWKATLRNLRDGHGLKVGDQVKFRGLIVDESFTTLSIWVDESTHTPAVKPVRENE